MSFGKAFACTEAHQTDLKRYCTSYIEFAKIYLKRLHDLTRWVHQHLYILFMMPDSWQSWWECTDQVKVCVSVIRTRTSMTCELFHWCDRWLARVHRSKNYFSTNSDRSKLKLAGIDCTIMGTLTNHHTPSLACGMSWWWTMSTTYHFHTHRNWDFRNVDSMTGRYEVIKYQMVPNAFIWWKHT